MMDWTTSCPDWERRIVAREPLVPLEPLFPEVAEDALDVFSALRMVDADGSPTMGEACLPWVMDLVAVLFGAYDPKRKRRLITNYFLMVSKKNGKSIIAAGVMLTALILNTRTAAEFLILAPTKEAADNAYKPIREMILADDDLSARFQEQQFIKTVTCRLSRATLKVVAADSSVVTGKKATGVFVDELHEFGKTAKAAAMLTEATGGITSRPEGFVFYCTTQSEKPPAGVFKDKLSYARKVRDGEVIDKRFLPVIYEFPKRMLDAKAHEDLDNAYITNPNWGVSVDAEVIQQKFQEAGEIGLHAVIDIQAKHLNIEVGMGLVDDRWPGADFWQQQAREHITFEYLMEHSEVITAGIDGGGLDDLLGLAFIGRHKTTGEWMGWVHAWAHPSVLERRKEIAPRLRDFASDGDLTIIENMGEDVTELSDMVAHVHQLGLLDKVGADPAGIAAILDALEARGIPPEKLVGVSQGWLLIGSVKAVERRLVSPQPNQSFVHADQPLMDWCVSNAKVVVSKAGYNISKAVSGTGKIDPVMALMDAAHLMALNPAAPKQSVYESRGIRFIRG